MSPAATCWPGPPISSIVWSGRKDWGFCLGRHDDSAASAFDLPDVVAREVHRRMEGRHVLLLTDFDGTLAELTPTPGEAVVDGAVCAELDRLSAFPDVTVGVVSGRRLVDVAARVGPAAEFVAGLHGLEISSEGAAFHHYALDAVESVIASLIRAAERELAWCPGVLLEDKTYSLTCHVRLSPAEMADRALEEFEALVEPQLEARVLKLLTAVKAMEVLPAVDWHKGRACAWIRARVAGRVTEPVSIVYLGDDRTDEDAFTALADDDVAIGVGDRPHTHLIDSRLEGPGAVGRFFGTFADLRNGRG